VAFGLEGRAGGSCGLPRTASGAMMGSFSVFLGVEEVRSAEGARPDQRTHAGGLPGPRREAAATSFTRGYGSR